MGEMTEFQQEIEEMDSSDLEEAWEKISDEPFPDSKAKAVDALRSEAAARAMNMKTDKLQDDAAAP